MSRTSFHPLDCRGGQSEDLLNAHGTNVSFMVLPEYKTWPMERQTQYLALYEKTKVLLLDTFSNNKHEVMAGLTSGRENPECGARYQKCRTSVILCNGEVACAAVFASLVLSPVDPQWTAGFLEVNGHHGGMGHVMLICISVPSSLSIHIYIKTPSCIVVYHPHATPSCMPKPYP